MLKIINKYTTSFAITMSVLAGCTNETFPIAGSEDVVTNAGTVSHKNYSVLASDFKPTVVSGGIFTKTDLTLTAYIGDRNNQLLTSSHTIKFYSEYGLVEPSCTTALDDGDTGFCTVTWSAIKPPVTGGPGDDNRVNVVVVTAGEEDFTDSNGNGIFDDGDGFTAAQDLEEPYIDMDNDNAFSAGDIVIDVVSTNDPTGANGVHDAADGFYNGAGCKHSTMCGTQTSIQIFADIDLHIDGT